MTRAPEETRPDRRRRLGLALAVGAAVVVLVELASLVAALATGTDPAEIGALWAILLMILATFGTVGAIGWGLYRSLGRDGEPGAADEREPAGGRPDGPDPVADRRGAS